MPSLLLDSHVILWLDTDPRRLPSHVAKRIRQSPDPVYVSAVTSYELSRKYRQGRLPEAEALATNFEPLIKQYEIGVLPVRLDDLQLAARFEWDHGDPFDRIIAAQAVAYRCILVTADAAFHSIGRGLEVLWEA